MKKCPNRKPVFAEVMVPGEPGKVKERIQVPVNRGARRLVEKRNRSARNKQVAAMRVVLRDMRDKLAKGLVPAEKLEKYREAFTTGREELRALLGQEA